MHAPAGTYPANPLGLHDLHGNVWEWCADHYAEAYSPLPQVDPRGPDAGSSRVKRGGAWDSPAFLARSAYRDHLEQNVRSPSTGCRPARPLFDQ